MSYDISLRDPKTGEAVTVDHHCEGGTRPVFGIDDAELNVTYNYGPFYAEHIDAEEGIRWLYGRTGRQVQERLEKAVAALGTERDSDYWQPTPGNAGYALAILLRWAKQHPTAVFGGD